MFNTKYNTSLKSALNICFSYVWIGRIKHIYSYYEIVFEELQKSFINGLEIAIDDSSLTDYKGVNRDNLREMVEIAREDWNNFLYEFEQKFEYELSKNKSLCINISFVGLAIFRK